jgi:S1-C subfamily serine protease
MDAHIDYERLYRDTIPSVVSIYVGRRAPAMGAGSGFVYDVVGPGDGGSDSDSDADSNVNSDSDANTVADGDAGDAGRITATSEATDVTGYVVTNEHVVSGVTDVELRFADGQWRTGRVVGRDGYTDLAVVSVPGFPAGIRPLPVAGENPTPGRPVAALGNPLGLDGSVTAGIVSGANRSMPTSGGFAVPDVVQTDAPINPGNSGGPLVAVAVGGGTAGADGDVGTDMDGNGSGNRDGDVTEGGHGNATAATPSYEVVGVNRARQGDNIGFAISPAIVTRVVPSLIDEGRYRHSYLRTRTLDVTPTVAEANGLDEPQGVLVVDVATGPAAGDRLRRSTGTRTVRGQRVPTGGDVIVGLNGRELRSHEELMRYLITETRPREPVEVDVIRDGEQRTLSVVLGERPDPDGRIPVN